MIPMFYHLEYMHYLTSRPLSDKGRKWRLLIVPLGSEPFFPSSTVRALEDKVAWNFDLELTWLAVI